MTEHTITMNHTVMREDGLALIRAGAESARFVAEVSGWYQLVDGQWTLIEPRDTPARPQQHRDGQAE